MIGAGHNALVSAAYVAQAGYRVAVFERRVLAGGAVSSEEVIPGYNFDFGGSAHILIRLTPIIEELGLERFGLEYIELDPIFFSPNEGEKSFFIYKDLDKTIRHLESIFPGEGERYKAFVEEWRPFAQAIRNTFLSSPSPFELGKSFVVAESVKIEWSRALSMILRPYGEVVDSYFAEERVKACLTWMAAQSGPPPTEPLSGPFLLWHPLYHEGGIARPKGGSGMLAQALQAHIEHHGGHIFTSAPVDEIVVEGRKAVGIKTQGYLYTAKSVLAGTHILESLGRLLPLHLRPASLAQIRTGNGFGAVLRLALSSPVSYAHCPDKVTQIPLQLICHDRDEINRAYSDYLRGIPSLEPPLVAMSFSAVDDSLSPPGGATLWLWGQYYPYRMSGNVRWEDIAQAEADRILDRFELVAPGTRDKVVGALFQHPQWLERELGLVRGNVMHIEMSLDQMFSLRPNPTLSGYRTHVDRLYLTGASTHPGGGIMGASGRNAARVLLKDLSR